jgi:uncharacterized alkaline shock family protein YloU
MRIALSVFFYTIILAVIGTCAIIYATNLVDFGDVVTWAGAAYEDIRLRVIVGAAGVLLILLSLSAAQIITGKIQREKTIAFSNPNGQVTVTLSAVEDLIKRLSYQLSEIKEAKADVKATKKGIDIRMRVVLRAETSIPDFTARLQDLIASRVQEVFGIDEPITVKIHVAKIITSDEKQKKTKPEKPEREEIGIPYQGMKI